MGFEPTISAGERPRTYALDRAVTGTGTFLLHMKYINYLLVTRGHTAAHLVEALRYKPEGRGFDF